MVETLDECVDGAQHAIEVNGGIVVPDCKCAATFSHRAQRGFIGQRRLYRVRHRAR